MEYLESFLVWVHIVTGSIAVLAGTGALAARKGRSFHIRAGRLFAASMVVASAFGALLGLLRADEFYITFHAGVIGVTLIASSILTLRSTGSRLGGWALGVAAANCLNLIALIGIGYYALGLPDGLLLGYHAGDYLFLSTMAGLAFVGDARLFLGRTLEYRQRIARHLWRMCLGFFIAAGSAFTGPGATAFPDELRKTGLLSLPELMILAFMLFWLIRTQVRPPTPNKDVAT